MAHTLTSSRRRTESNDDDLPERVCIILEACPEVKTYERALEIAKEQKREAERKKLGNKGWEQRRLV